jgi:bifunctional UDP-N-acetylglucosamine pyrophosphorylase/glucosamine-1-phosphate N-acetyltransferase
MSERAAVIMAAGQGTRMRSPTPKVLHEVGGRAMLDRAIDAAEALGCSRIVVVVGTHSPAVPAHVAKRLGEAAAAVQDPPLGTGHAVLSAERALEGFEGDVVVLNADCPLLTADDLSPLFALREAGADLALLGFEPEDAVLYGRLVVEDGAVLRIVEARDASPAEKAIRQCYAGFLAAPATKLFGWLDKVGNDNAKGEYYLTDIVKLAVAEGARVKAAFAPETAVMGADSQAQVSRAEALWQARRRRELLDSGVTMAAPETVMLSFDTEIAPGSVVEPYVVFGPGVKIAGPCRIRAFSHLEGATVEAGAVVGPYSRLRPGARIGEEAHIGNFVEVKALSVGKGAKANHLAYLGDGEIGAGSNIGAGTIFCNYDGFRKHKTIVGTGAFIGSNSSLVAPVSVGDGAYVGSGSVITKNVEAGALALTRAPQVEKPGWAARFREAMLALKGRK